jgi:hypothetical protein
MPANRRTLVLGSVLGVVVILVAFYVTSGGSGAASGPSVPPRRPAPNAPNAPGAANAPSDVGRVNLEALTTARAEPLDAARNPFRFQPRAAPPPPPSAATTALPPPRPLNQTPMFTAPPVPTGPPPPPPIPLKFLGFVTQGNKRVAVLSDGKSAPQYGVEGDIILGQYQILKIGNESIEMAYFDGRGRQTIRITGQ